MKHKVKIKLLRENAVCPSYQSASAAGADLYAALESAIAVEAGQSVLVPTGVAMEIPEGFVGLVYARSGLATKKGLAPANKVGVIDSDYRGEIMVALHNHSGERAQVLAGERIAQIVIAPYLTAEFEPCDELSETARGEGGFGSTGK
ncbi:MAG: dUTP diphosphatase [Oscillospiraceae bacterium]|nr:dUTP diphosphatase [Oscillospiraceae bacterium]